GEGGGGPWGEMGLGGSPATSSSFRKMWPDVGRSTPVRQLKKVDLPAPLGPMMARISPRATDTLTLFTAVSPPNRMVSPSVRRMRPEAGPPAPPPPRWAPGGGAPS